MFDFKVLRFAILVCLACSLLVSGAAIGLRDRQVANQILDMRKNILKSVDLYEEGLQADDVNRVFNEQMKGVVLTSAGEVVEGRTPEDVDVEKEPDLLFLYQRLDEGEVVAYTFPISGKGLWSTIYGYFALEADLNTVKGITFYQHGETPGLGGEIEKSWFTASYVGKKILGPGGTVMSIMTVKGKAKDRYPDDLDHYVDGVSGATITCDGLSKFLKTDIERYEAYFARIRGGAGEETA